MISIAAPSFRASASRGGGLLSGFVRRAARVAARRPRLTIGLWMLLVVACVVGGLASGTRSLTSVQQGVGESGRADARLAAADLRDRAVESVLVRSGSAAQTRATVEVLAARLRRLAVVASVQGPDEDRALSVAGGRSELVQTTLRGDPDDASDHVAAVQRTVAAVARAHSGVSVQEAGQGSLDRTETTVVDQDLHRAELISLPITLLILVFAFGALGAALVPLVLALTSVAATLGALGVVSQVVPSSDTTASCVVLIGLAVGIDYSLFYVRREREERRSGRGAEAALDAAAGTAGRAVLVSGLTVMIGLAGLLLSGTADFTSVALGTILVVAISVLGSLTVLPAMLALLGDRVEKGRILRRRRAGVPRRRGWSALAGAVTRHPVESLVMAVCVLGALAVPALHLHSATPSDMSDLPALTPTVVAERAIERAFPGAPSSAELVVAGDDLASPEHRRALIALGDRARALLGGHGDAGLTVAQDGRTALVTVPMPATSEHGQSTDVRALRARVAPTASLVAPGARALVSGEAAESVDFAAQLASTLPGVIAFVLGLAFLLLLVSFGSAWLAAVVIGLNLLSVAAAYGVLTAVFQNTWAQHLLGFTSSGTVASWLPLFFFVILFGLSMDYTVLVLERVREARRAGQPVRAAAAEGIAATGATLTSAAIIMVAVFAIFGTLRLLEFKQLGIGLAAAVLLDATIVRAIALPAAIALLGERRWPIKQDSTSMRLQPRAGRKSGRLDRSPGRSS